MQKFKVEFGSDCRGQIDIDKVVVLEGVKDERDLIRQSLLLDFEDLEELLEYWEGWYGMKDLKEVIDFIIEVKEEDLEEGIDEGYICAEERFFKATKIQ
jgi:hypothetical protein